MSTISTHVLDTAAGKPAAGVALSLTRGADVISKGMTDADGRFRCEEPVGPGEYRIEFEVGNYFDRTSRDALYRNIVVGFTVSADVHYHVPLLLSPFGYSTYRGS